MSSFWLAIDVACGATNLSGITATQYPIARDRITAEDLLGHSRSEHSAQAETLDMQEVTGSSPVSPTRPVVA